MLRRAKNDYLFVEECLNIYFDVISILLIDILEIFRGINICKIFLTYLI